jgi:hypothetical protein
MPSDIISTPPSPASPANSTIVTADFWPNIDVNAVRESLELGGEIPHVRLLEALWDGVIFVTDELAAWRALQAAAGFATLTAVAPTEQVDGKTRLELLFVAAVSAYAAARIAARNPDLTATDKGSDRGDQRRAMADDFLADCTRSIRQIQGLRRVVAELV